MTSPLPPDIPDTGKLDKTSLSTSVKIFAAATTLLVGSAIAVVFWKSSLESVENPLLDRQLITAPRPGNAIFPKDTELAENTANVRADNATPESPTVIAVSLPAILPLPAADTGNAKYAQTYPPPKLPNETPKRDSTAGQEGQTTQNHPKAFLNTPAKFDPIHRLSDQPPETKLPQSGFSEKPRSISSIEMKDELLPFFHYAENLKPLSKVETQAKIEPENPFQKAPSSSEYRRLTVGPEKLLPLKPFRQTDEPISQLLPLRSGDQTASLQTK